MAGYVDDPLKPGVVKFVVIARNGDNIPHSEFRLDDAVARTAHEAAVARFLAPGHWVPMRVGTLTAPTMADLKAAYSQMGSRGVKGKLVMVNET